MDAVIGPGNRDTTEPE